MKNKILLLFILVSQLAMAGGRSTPAPIQEPKPDIPVVVTPTPDSPAVFVAFGSGASPTLKPGGVDYEYGQKTLALMNEAVSSGCILEKALAWDFKSLHGVVTPALQKFQKLEAMQRFLGGAPYALDARWYSTRKSVVGYTYNCLGGECYKPTDPTETRVWTNTRYNLSEEDYGAHLFHELSHQKWSGGFVHWSFHQGSFPYEIGDIATECILAQQRRPKLLKMAAHRAQGGRPSAGRKPLFDRHTDKLDPAGCAL